MRSLGAEVEQPYAVIEWIEKMGQPLYAFQAPTGYPDRADAWLNTGSLVARMNFGLQLATRHVPGVRVDLVALGQGQEPGSRSMTAALETYLALLLPERDPGETMSHLSSALADPDLAENLETAARPASTTRSARADSRMAMRQGGRRNGRGGDVPGDSADFPVRSRVQRRVQNTRSGAVSSRPCTCREIEAPPDTSLIPQPHEMTEQRHGVDTEDLVDSLGTPEAPEPCDRLCQ